MPGCADQHQSHLPPIAPLGLEYVAEALHAAGHEPRILDLCWSEDWRRSIADFFSAFQPRLVGLTLRNTDDCALSSRHSFLPDFAAIGRAPRASCPEALLGGRRRGLLHPSRTGARAECGGAGVWGDGEFAFVALADRVAAGQDWRDLPNLVWREGAQIGETRRPSLTWPSFLPCAATGSTIARYFAQGGQAGFESKRGCPAACLYCADPVAKGRRCAVRPPAAVADEIACSPRPGD